MEAPRTPLHLRIAASVGAIAVIGLVGAALLGDHGVARHERLKSELVEVVRMNRTLAQENQHLARQAEALKSDAHYIESVVRDELGWVRPDELVFIFSDEGAR